MKIFLGTDHAGYKLKEKVKIYLEEKKIPYEDLGTNSTKPVDYPDFILPAVKNVAKTNNSLGIIFGGSGQGEAMVANKVKGIRATVLYAYNKRIIKLSKEHNNANVLSFGARFLSDKEAIKAINLWLRTKFTRETRHKRRIKKINQIEKNINNKKENKKFQAKSR